MVASTTVNSDLAELGLVRVTAVAGGFEQEYSEFGSECGCLYAGSLGGNARSDF
ncbi:hypothetical protein QUA24_05640 [Microcoleus sp. Pol12B5]